MQIKRAVVNGSLGTIGIALVKQLLEKGAAVYAVAFPGDPRIGRIPEGAKVIGEVTEEEKGRVVLHTEIGTETYLPQPGNELLPRIC